MSILGRVRSWVSGSSASPVSAPPAKSEWPTPVVIGKAAALPPKDPNMGGGSYGAVPIFDNGMKFADLGSTGLRAFSGWVREEFLPQLVGRQAARVYREMTDNSPTVGAIMFAITGIMRKVEWRCQPVDDTPAAQEMADFAESLRFDMSHSWEDFVVEWLSMLNYGFSAHEIVYKRRQGYQKSSSPTPSSKFDDGRIGWRRLPIRAQDTILKWFFGVNGEILGLTQQPWVGPLTDIPIEKLLLFRASTHKNNPEGRSILRNAYLPYYYIKRLQEQEAILFERLSGLPVATVPNALLEAAAADEPAAVAALNAYKKLVTNVRIDEQMGVLLPSDTYQSGTGPTSVPMYSFKLETPNAGRSNLDANTPISRYKTDIMTSVLADFLEMGHSSRGAKNLADTKVDVFMNSVEAWLNSGAAVINRHALPRLWEMNSLDPALMPEMVPDMAQRVDLDGLSNFILRMSQAGMPLFPDPDLETYVRDTAGLPDVAEHAGYAAEMTADAGSDPETKAAKRSKLEKAIELAVARRVEKVLKNYGIVKRVDPEDDGTDVSTVTDDDLQALFHPALIESAVEKWDPGQPRGSNGRWVPSAAEATSGGKFLQQKGFTGDAIIGSLSPKIKKYGQGTTVSQFIGSHPKGKAYALRLIAADHKAGKIALFEPSKMAGRVSPERESDIHDAVASMLAQHGEELEKLLRKYDPSQPRVPAGSPEGGEWTHGGGGAAVAAADAAAASAFHASTTAEQKSALKKYIGEDYQDINSAFRKGKKPAGRHADTAKHMDAALKKASLHRDMTLYRGIDKDGVKALGELKVGSIIKDKAFASTSSSLDVAKKDAILQKGFASRYSSGGGVLMEISAPKGSKAADISALADNPGERETLLARNSSFRIDAYDPASQTLKVTLVQ